MKSLASELGLRVLLSLSPPRNPRTASPQDFARLSFFPRVTLGGMSEKGTTRSLNCTLGNYVINITKMKLKAVLFLLTQMTVIAPQVSLRPVPNAAPLMCRTKLGATADSDGVLASDLIREGHGNIFR